MVQSYITLSIFTGEYTPRDIEVSVRVLDVFNEANNLKPLKQRVDYRDFNNDAINKEVSLKEHYVHWIEEREKCKH